LLANIGLGLLKGAFTAAFTVLPGLIINAAVTKLGGESGDTILRAIARKLAGEGSEKVVASTLSKSLSTAFGATGIGALIGIAIGASDIDAIAGEALQKKLDSGELQFAGSVGGAKLITGMLNAISFGLLGDDFYLKVTEALANVMDGIFSKISEIMGVGFAASISSQLDGVFRLFAGFGDVIMGILTLDFSKITEGIFKMLGGVLDQALGMIGTFTALVRKLVLYFPKVVISVIKNIYGFFSGDKEMHDAINKWGTKVGDSMISWGKNFGKKFANIVLGTIKEVTDVLNISDFSIGGNSINSLLADFKTGPETGKTATQAMVNAVTPDPNAIRDSLESSTEEIKGIALNNLNAFGDEITQYQNLTPEQIKKTQDNLNTSLKKMQDIIGGIDNQALTNMREAFAKLDTGAISLFEGLMTKINESFDISKLAEIDAKLMVIDERIITRLQTIMHRSLAVGALAEEFKTKYSGGLVSYIENTAAELEELDALLSDIKIASIDNTIDSLNNKLLVNNKKINIENKPINIHLNLGVSFKAEDFTKNIFAVAGKLVKTGNTTLSDFTNNTFTEYVKDGKMSAT
jgi:hypothetical protein